MRRILRWTLPAGIALATALVFATGFTLALRGGVGEPVGSVAAGDRVATAPASGKPLIIILGDSLARGAGDASGRGIGGNLDEMLAGDGVDPEIANLAVNGARTADLLEKIGRPSVRDLAARSSAIVVSIGGNDLFGISTRQDGRFTPAPGDPRESFGEVLERVETILRELRAASPGARIYLLGLYDPFASRGDMVAPYIAAWNSALVDRFGDDPRITIVQTADLFVGVDRLSADRFHPNQDAYERIARRIADSAGF
jgi:lysophospholipase L1-like esterase